MTNKVNVGKQFSRYPAGRFPTDGKFNGETFRKKFLLPYILLDQEVIVELDDAIDYGSSFLEEAFGGLVRVENLDSATVLRNLNLISKDSFLIEEILLYIREAS